VSFPLLVTLNPSHIIFSPRASSRSFPSFIYATFCLVDLEGEIKHEETPGRDEGRNGSVEEKV
jgi:hypothetical protein